MDHKSFEFEFKAAAGNDRTFEGYASSWKKDLIDDQIIRGAFSKTIQERMPKNQIKVLWQHDANQPIGVPIHMEEDSRGLFIKARLADTTLGRDCHQLMKEGIIDQMSIGYDVLKDNFTKSGIRELSEIRLYEFSPVTFACNPDAQLTAVKHMNQIDTLLKSGRVFSSANAARLRSIMAELESLLSTGEPPAAEPPTDTSLGTQLNEALDSIKQFNDYITNLGGKK